VAAVPPTTVTEELVVAATAKDEATRTATQPATLTAANAPHRINEIHRAKQATEVSDSDGFRAYSVRLRDLLLPEKFKSLRITKYDAK
jgi:hypothetical protein